MREVEVVAAIIVKDKKVLATKRLEGEFDGMWEFPGGKIEKNETHPQALIREIREELESDIIVNDFLCTIHHTYSTFKLVMHCYICSIQNNCFVLNNHSDYKWLEINTLHHLVDWIEADIKILDYIQQYNNK